MLERVELSGVGKIYGSRRVLQKIDLVLAPGEMVALLGPNGAGKSTLLQILSTLLRPSEGALRVAPQRTASAWRRAIGVIAHDAMCYPDLSGQENLELFARLYRAEVEVALLLSQVGLAEAAHRPARTYSRGMLQRLAVARALVHRPSLYLCDEPFTGLDRAGAAMLAKRLAEERGRGATVVCATHDFEALSGLVDRVLVLDRGRLIHAGSLVDRTAGALARLYQQHVERIP